MTAEVTLKFRIRGAPLSQMELWGPLACGLTVSFATSNEDALTFQCFDIVGWHWRSIRPVYNWQVLLLICLLFVGITMSCFAINIV